LSESARTDQVFAKHELDICIGLVSFGFSRACVYSVYTTGKTGIAMRLFFAVSYSTVKKSLPCANSRTHGNDIAHGKVIEKRTVKKIFTAKSVATHGNDTAHGKERKERTAKKKRWQRHSKPHGK
jgi:hypothetical protein